MPLTTVSNAWREDGREAWLPSQGKPNRGRPALGQARVTGQGKDQGAEGHVGLRLERKENHLWAASARAVVKAVRCVSNRTLEDRDCQGMPLTTVSNAWREDGREAWLPSQGKPIRGRPVLGNGRRHETRQRPGRRRPRGPSAEEKGKPPVGCVSAGRRQSRSLRQQSHPARFVAGAGNLWHAYAHKGSPLFRRRAPARNTLGPRGLLTARAAARRQEAPRGRGKAHRSREWRRARFVEQ